MLRVGTTRNTPRAFAMTALRWAHLCESVEVQGVAISFHRVQEEMRLDQGHFPAPRVLAFSVESSDWEDQERVLRVTLRDVGGTYYGIYQDRIPFRRLASG